MQGLTCKTEPAGSNVSAYVVLEFMGQSATVKANATVSDLSDYLQEMTRDAGLDDYAVNVTSPDGQATVCGIDGNEVCDNSLGL